MLEPWDGPAAILFSDGDVVGAVLDRNGLRPSRYYITKDGRLILSSEVGVLDIPAEEIVRKDRLRPGKMLLVDTARGELVDDESLKADYASREPYGEWLDRNLVNLADLKIPNERVPSHEHDELVRLQKAFGYQYEDVSTMILPMAKNGAEPAGAMGSDTPLAVLSHTHPPLFEYFKQMFAQVTNPPIDALREKVVTSTTVYVGAQGNLLEEDAENCKVLKITNPILTETDLMKIKAMKVPGFKVETISICYYKNTDLEKAIDRLFVDVDRYPMNHLFELKTIETPSIPLEKVFGKYDKAKCKYRKEKHITDMVEAMRYGGQTAHVIVNYRAVSRTFAIPASKILAFRYNGSRKSIPWQWAEQEGIEVKAKRLRVHWRYDVDGLLKRLEKENATV